MPSNTELDNGLHLVKAVGRHTTRMTVPKPLCESAKISNGMYLAVMSIGPCLVVTPITDVSKDGAHAEFARAFEKMVKAWEKKT